MTDGRSHPSPPFSEMTTRDRLLSAGVRLFGPRGYDAVTTRELAIVAGSNLAAIGYHFQDKRGLYIAVAEHISATTGQAIESIATETKAAIAINRNGDPEAEQQLVKFCVTIFELFSGDGEKALHAQFILREHYWPREASPILEKAFLESTIQTFSALISRLHWDFPDSKEIYLLSHALIGQVLGMASVFRSAYIRRNTVERVSIRWS